MLPASMTQDKLEERSGRILDIDAPPRRICAEISEIDRQLEDPALRRTDQAALRARKRELWTQHDESLKEWQWKASRIARTEIHGATEGGAYALAVEEAGGEAGAVASPVRLRRHAARLILIRTSQSDGAAASSSDASESADTADAVSAVGCSAPQAPGPTLCRAAVSCATLTNCSAACSARRR